MTDPTPDPIASGDHTPGCGRPGCGCRDTRRPPCDEWMGLDGDRWCPRCGWTRDRHDGEEVS